MGLCNYERPKVQSVALYLIQLTWFWSVWSRYLHGKL